MSGNVKGLMATKRTIARGARYVAKLNPLCLLNSYSRIGPSKTVAERRHLLHSVEW